MVTNIVNKQSWKMKRREMRMANENADELAEREAEEARLLPDAVSVIGAIILAIITVVCCALAGGIHHV